ncbi:MAG: protoheme IX farnesyltransferase, partial [Flavobacteriales bacterium]
MRLTILVIISAILGYLLATPLPNLLEMTMLICGGTLITGASNGFNQLLEKEQDSVMARTCNRPIAANRINIKEGIIVGIISALIGMFLLWYFLNPLTGVLAMLSLFVYVFLYTPLKRITPLAVIVGAFPGAVPPMLGWVAVTSEFG